MSHLTTLSGLRGQLGTLLEQAESNDPIRVTIALERLDTALQLVFNALDDDTHASVITINRNALRRDLATALRLDTSATEQDGGQ